MEHLEMMMVDFNIHPLLFFAFQILATTLVVGFATSHSLLRPAILPLIASCAYGITTTSPSWMRLHWASLLSGSSVGFVLQYVELALLSRWSFEERRDAILRPTGRVKANHSATSNGTAKASGVATQNGHVKENGGVKRNGLAKPNDATSLNGF